MSIDSAQDLNVFFSSSRVDFGEPPPETTSTSLLTFADMVLALERQNISESFEITSSVADICAESDHTYASSGCSRTTRSQTAKAAAHLSNRLTEQEEKWKVKDQDVESVPGGNELVIQNFFPNYLPKRSEDNSRHLRGKRCSSVENICNSETELTSNGCRVCEWPEVLPKNSPRKSSSFEEVSCDNSKSSLKSSKSTENVPRAGVSYTLHRFVNNTLEFPCWPRKADHTYATATWDGTAASHSLFEQELRQDSTAQNIMEDQEMEEADHIYLQQSQCDELSESSDSQHSNFTILAQKDDHTYVKSKLTSFSSPAHIDADVFNLGTDIGNLKRQVYLSATFPRHKTREDHTYFHSGLSRRSSCGSGDREWASTQTVPGILTQHDIPGSLTQRHIRGPLTHHIPGPLAQHHLQDSLTQHDIQVEEAYRKLNSFSQSASAKKDHNYSTSA